MLKGKVVTLRTVRASDVDARWRRSAFPMTSGASSTSIYEYRT
jgi:hypothetical protein